ncbi:HAD family acid phosphatase [Streptomyces sp. KS 21]|uniref:HAD family acid phosphatase n=1 Tax=Streptomyces sp. KS 21 TaxID=2485150 RepID=UPI001063641A|nr:HAD family acid phosphatase [Streptomyces sp. KS 21]TDU74217.1 putative acid phosphatase of HAD superfamily subfamily IIIB [Streptomyces sp. KS 21]
MRSTRARIRTLATATGTATATVVLMLAPVASAQAAPVPTPAPAAAPAAATASAPGGNALIRGIDYGTWKRDVAAVMATARPYVEQRIARSPAGEKPAIVLDIDNSSLETDFHWFWTFPTPAISEVRDLTRYADEHGVAIIFVTARPGIIHSLTEHNLKAVGYPVSDLYVRDLPDLFSEVSTYKTAKRAEIEARGYTIIANIGNNNSDLVGGHAERTFKLPDYDGKLS